MTQTDTTIPQRAVRAEPANDEAAKAPLPPLPEHDAFEGVEHGQPRSAAHDADEHTTEAASLPAADIDRHIEGDDPYAGIDTEQRPAGFVRQPFGEARLKLQAPARPGYWRYWFKDTPGRIDDALRAGFSFVKLQGRNIRIVSGRARNGGAEVSYLMEIPEQWHAQDVRSQQAKVDAIDNAIRGGTIGAEPGKMTQESDQRYVPKEGISYEPRKATRDG